MRAGAFFRAGLVAGGMIVAGSAVVLADPAVKPDDSRPGEAIAFDVARKGDDIGYHRITFARDGEDLRVNVDIRLRVKFAFITVFRYDHTSEEVWRDGQLVSLDARTRIKDRTSHVTGRAVGGGFEVSGIEGTALLPADVLPTSHWHPDMIDADELLDTQTGKLVPVSIAPSGRKTVDATWGDIQAQTFDITAGETTFTLAYDGGGCLVDISYRAKRDNSLIAYALTDHPLGDEAVTIKHPLLAQCLPDGPRTHTADRHGSDAPTGAQ